MAISLKRALRISGVLGLLVGACTLGARDKDELSGGGGKGGKDAGTDGSAGSSGACDTDHLDCDGVSVNGCETLVASDPKNCGKCSNVCPSPNGNTPTCTDGVCGTSNCKAPSLDCDSDPATCETNPLTSAENCGYCGNACKFANATASCAAGVCQLEECDPIHADCDGVQANGCEVALDTLTDCGGCATACLLPNAKADCSTGACALTGCNPGFENCDNVAANGCEGNLQSDPQNCGKCGNVCGAGLECKGGVCQVSNCTAPLADCDADPTTCETNVQTSAAHCGFCNNPCNLTNATAACTAGACTVASCTTGYGNCDSNAANGCETTLGSNTNCSACGDQCSGGPHVAVGACNKGACVITCSAGYGNCDNNGGNGCETDTTSDPSNCGVCGNVCPTGPNATATCTSGVCGLNCAAGFDDCSTAPGCETNVLTSAVNCGACGRTCSPCNAGFCAPDVLSSNMSNARALDQSGQYVYIGRMPGGLFRISKSFGSPQAIEAGANVQGLDWYQGEVFWVDPNKGVFRRNDSGAGGTNQLSSNLGGYGIDVFTDGNVYFTSLQTPAVARTSQNVGPTTTIDSNPAAHGVRGNQGSLFWTVPSLGQIRTAALPGTGVAQLATGQSSPEGIDADGGFVYWANNGDGTIRRMPTNQSTGPVDIATGQTGAFALKVSGAYIYWTTALPSGGLYRAPIAGGTVAKLAQNLADPRALTVDNSKVYWAEFGSGVVASVPK